MMRSFLFKLVESVSIPVISNGGSLDIKNYDDIINFRVRLIHSQLQHES